jgi:hypothetical protein
MFFLGEEILSSDLLQLADRVKYGISQISTNTLSKLTEILAKIEGNTQDEISANAKAIRQMILIYLTSGDDFKFKLKQVGEDILEKKKQVNNLRADLKEVFKILKEEIKKLLYYHVYFFCVIL